MVGNEKKTEPNFTVNIRELKDYRAGVSFSYSLRWLAHALLLFAFLSSSSHRPRALAVLFASLSFLRSLSHPTQRSGRTPF